MRAWLEKIRRNFSNWMIGRYGTDELSRFLIYTGLILMVLSWFVGSKMSVNIPYTLAWILVIWSYFRIFSKNIIKRSKERDTYLRLTGKFRSKTSVYKKMWKDRKTHNYYRCPQCKTMIRVPKGKGKIAISCPKCRNEIIKTT